VRGLGRGRELNPISGLVVKIMQEALAKFVGGSTQVEEGNRYPEEGMASVVLRFVDGSELYAEYWRLIRDGRAHLSSFDHRQQYGLPAPINAVKELRDALQNKIVISAALEEESGDLVFLFSSNIKLQIFNFTGYEMWHIRFSSGAEEYSNFNR